MPSLHKQSNSEGKDSLDTDPNEFGDLSHIHHVSDLNHRQNIHKESASSDVLNVDNIAVDLDDDDLEQMQRIISQHEMETFLNAKKI